MTVNELLDQHHKVLRAKADLDDINFLYPEDDGNGHLGNGLRASFYDGALKRYLDEVKKLKELMDKATPDVITEARRKAKAEQEKK